jgi:hypothetical protein
MPLRPLIVFLLVLLAVAPARAEQAADCAAAAKPGWSESEAWAWQQICAGKAADFAAARGGAPASHRLSADFLAGLLFDARLKSAIPHGGLHIAGAEVAEPLFLGNAAPGFELALERMRFAGEVDLHGLAASAGVSFAGSRFSGRLDLEGARLGANLVLSGVTAGEVSLLRASVGGSTLLDGLRIDHGLNLERLTVAGNLVLRRARLPGLSLLAASIAGDLSFEDGSVGGWAWLENLRVGSDLFMQRAHLARTDVIGASVGGNLLLTGATVDGALDLRATKVGGDLRMDGGASFQSVALPDASIGDNLRFGGAHLKGALAMPAIHVGHLLALGPEAAFDGPVELSYARVDGGILLSSSHFAGNVALDGVVIGQNLVITEGATVAGTLSAAFARIGSNVDLTGGNFNSVDLTGTTIGSEIRLASSDHPSIAWGPAAKLTLRNLSAKALQDLPQAWPADLDVEGFTYQQLGGYGQGESAGVAERDVQSLIDWLAKQKRYSPQPYRTLSEVLRSSGYPDKAKRVLYAGYLREWEAGSGLDRAWDGLRWAIIGFGLYPQRSALWIFVLVPLGALIFGYDRAVRLRAMGDVDKLIYSLDALLPIVTLRQEHNAFDLQSWPKYYLYFHKVMGYVLIAFLLAALTGTS